MNRKFDRVIIFLSLMFSLLEIPVNGKAQDKQETTKSKRSRDVLIGSWLFHKGEIAMKRQVKAGRQGGITDINVKLIAKQDTVIRLHRYKKCQ